MLVGGRVERRALYTLNSIRTFPTKFQKPRNYMSPTVCLIRRLNFKNSEKVSENSPVRRVEAHNPPPIYHDICA